MDINEIIKEGRLAKDIINDLQQKSVIVPSWADLEKEYNTDLHEVMNKEKYPDKMDKHGNVTKQSRVTYGLQKLAVNRMTGMIFGIPVKRIYDAKDEAEKRAANIMEDIFHRNRINSVNIARSKDLYASCEMATLWYTQSAETEYAGEKSHLKLRNIVYSPKRGYQLYPLFDEYNDMIAFSFQYTRTIGDKSTTYFDTYTESLHIRWVQSDDGFQEVLREKVPNGKIPLVYADRPLPIWEHQSRNVEELESKMSKEGNYITKNSKPTFMIYSDNDLTFGNDNNANTDRSIIKLGQNDRAGYETWTGSQEATKHYTEELKRNFFSELQLPDFSFDNMKTVPMSGEARKMMFIDAQLKVLDESGIWLEAFSREVNVVKSFMKEMYPNLSSAIESLKVGVEITPYQIEDERDHINNLTNATGGKPIMSQRTAIRRAGYVDDPDEELELINKEKDTIDIFEQMPAE